MGANVSSGGIKTPSGVPVAAVIVLAISLPTILIAIIWFAKRRHRRQAERKRDEDMAAFEMNDMQRTAAIVREAGPQVSGTIDPSPVPSPVPSPGTGTGTGPGNGDGDAALPSYENSAQTRRVDGDGRAMQAV